MQKENITKEINECVACRNDQQNPQRRLYVITVIATVFYACKMMVMSFHFSDLEVEVICVDLHKT